jgi:hypothetical protein
VCWDNGKIVTVNHDSESEYLLHKTEKDFFETICNFYVENIYFLDEDGYLDYDFERYGEVGKKYNPGIEYWE